MKKVTLYIVLIFMASACSKSSKKEQVRKPNIILILADDLGYGDLTCYNKDSKIPTPNID